MKEHDSVTIMVTLPDHKPPIYRGDYGTIISIKRGAYEVETNQESMNKVLVTLNKDQIDTKMWTTRELLQHDLELPDESFSTHCSDLQVLDSEGVGEWLKKNQKYYTNIVHSYSNVTGQSWYGKRFFDIPFANLDYYSKKSLADKVKEQQVKE